MKSGIAMLRDTLLVSTASFVAFAVSSLAGILIARSLSPAEYGRVGYFINLVMIGILLADFGLSLKLVSDLASADSPETRSRSFYTLLAFRLLTALVLVGVGAVLGLVSDPLYLYAGGIILVAVLASALLAALQGLHKSATVALVLWIQPVVFVVLLWLGAGQQPELVFAALGVSYLCAAGANAWGVGVSREIARPRRAFLSQHYILRALPPSLLIYAAVLLGTAYPLAPTLLLGMFAQYVGAAQFSIAVTLVRFGPLLMATVLGTILYPRLCAYFARATRDNALPLLARTYQGVVVVAIGMTVLLAVNADFLLRLIYTNKYADLTPLLRVCAPLCFIFALESWGAQALVAAGRVRRLVELMALRLGVFLLGALIVLNVHLIDETQALLVLAGFYVIVGLIALWAELGWTRQITGFAMPRARSAFALIMALAVGAGLYAELPPVANPLITGVYQSGLTLLVALGIAALFMYSAHLRGGGRRRYERVTSAVAGSEHKSLTEQV